MGEAAQGSPRRKAAQSSRKCLLVPELQGARRGVWACLGLCKACSPPATPAATSSVWVQGPGTCSASSGSCTQVCCGPPGGRAGGRAGWPWPGSMRRAAHAAVRRPARAQVSIGDMLGENDEFHLAVLDHFTTTFRFQGAPALAQVHACMHASMHEIVHAGLQHGQHLPLGAGSRVGCCRPSQEALPEDFGCACLVAPRQQRQAASLRIALASGSFSRRPPPARRLRTSSQTSTPVP